MKTVNKKITIKDLRAMAQNGFGNLVKAVVDVKKGMMVVDAELHADEEAELIKNKSAQSDLWGINLYPELYPDDSWLEFDSMINLRPSQGNRTRGVESSQARKKIIQIVKDLVNE